MRISFRQGVVSHQTGPTGFLQLNISGNIDCLANNRPVTVTTAHKDANYIFSEDKTVENAWIGPFAGPTKYWLYWDFDLLTWDRTFGYTTLEPLVQPLPPGNDDTDIIDVASGVGSPLAMGSFVVPGLYRLEAGRTIEVVNSTSNNGTYTVASAIYNSTTGNTTITVNETVGSDTVDGQIVLDFDSYGQVAYQNGRMWFDTSTFRHYELVSGVWTERLRVFACLVQNGNTFTSLGTTASPSFIGTQVGNWAAAPASGSIQAGRVVREESTTPVTKDDGTFLTTEDQFWTDGARVDAIRLESNVARAQCVQGAIGAFTVVAWVGDGKIITAQYDHVGRGDPGDPLPPDDETTVIGVLTQDLTFRETGTVIIQGVITNPLWNWLNVTRVGGPLWVDNGMFVPQDPHFNDVVNFPIGRVPVARVLSSDTIVFEQGLGGKGDRGPAGIVDSYPAHSHTAAEISVTPASCITSSNVQAALVEICDLLNNITVPPTPDLYVPYDLAFFVAGVPTASAKVGGFVVTRDVYIDSAAAHRAYAGTGAGEGPNEVYSIQNYAGQVGTVTFPTGGTTGTVSIPTSIMLNAGDYLWIVAPANATNVADALITLVGCALAAPCTIP